MDTHSEKNVVLKILSIDIGIINLGYVYSEGLNVLECNRVDITKVKHNKVPYCNCKLHHDFCIPDYLDHFIQENPDIFKNSDIILIERQPPVGITNVQDLIFTKFRNKVKLVSPNTIHKFFKMSKCDYDTRKIESLELTNKYLKQFTTFQNNERKHDISDAMLMIIYYLTKEKKCNTFFSLKPPNKIDVMDYFDTFKFLPVNDFERFKFTKT
jgi:hypothetical protein